MTIWWPAGQPYRSTFRLPTLPPPGRLHHVGYDAGIYVDAQAAQSVLTLLDKPADGVETAGRIHDCLVTNQDQVMLTHPSPSVAL